MSWVETQARQAKTTFHSPLPVLTEPESAIFRKIVVLRGLADDERPLSEATRTLAGIFGSNVCFLRGRSTVTPPDEDAVSATNVTELSCGSWPAWEAAVRAQSPSLVLMTETCVPSECTWFGTTAQRFVRHHKWPIWVLRPHVPWRLSSILCLMDFSEAGLRALQTAARLAGALDATLTLLHVVLETGTDARAETTVWHALKAQDEWPVVTAVRRYPIASAQDDRALIAAARFETDELLRHVDLSGARTQVVVTSGTPANSALREARERGANLVVAAQGSHLAYTLLQVQSPAEELVASCPVPVLVLS